MNKPKMIFEDEKEAELYLKEWQERLFLTDWTLRIILCEPNEFSGEDKDLWGQCDGDHVDKSAVIRILKKGLKEDRITKKCHECILIHELLHCKYMSMTSDTIEGKYYETKEHGLLESMAKSLLMAKYDLKFDWFMNREV
jgi:hypothetical protein